MTGPLTLAVATATNQVGVGLGRSGGPVSSIAFQQGRRHGELLAPAVQTLTRMSGVRLTDVELVAVDNGPGLFTGLRVGVATAKALAGALGLQVVPCSSLDLLAHPHLAAGTTTAAVVDARRGEVFWAVYEPSGDSMVASGDPKVSAPEELAGELSSLGRPVIAAGDGARRYADQLGAVGSVTVAGPEHDHPSPVVLVELAATRAGLSPEKVTPEYLRGADVRIGWEQRDG